MRAKRAVWLTMVGAVVTTGGVLASGTPGQADPAVASATLVDINNNRVGDALFTSNGDGSVKGRISVTIDTAVTDPGGVGAEFHGFHIHANNDDDNLDDDPNDGCITFDTSVTPAPSAWFTQVDGHWDVGGHAHGSHSGDLPSLVRQHDGETTIEFVVDKFGAGSLPGKALVVHFQADDFGKHPGIGTSSTTGNAGPRYACGLIVASARG